MDFRKEILVDMEDAKYRPMGLAQGPDGSLFISESKKVKFGEYFFLEIEITLERKS